jgi:hypothetical protein
VTGANHLLQRIETFLQRRLRGTDQLERGKLGEFRLSILNAVSGCIPALQRRFSATVLQGHFRNTGACDAHFHVETETANLPSKLGAEGIGEERYPVARHTTSALDKRLFTIFTGLLGLTHPGGGVRKRTKARLGPVVFQRESNPLS